MMRCIICRMMTKWCHDTWQTVQEYWLIGVGVIVFLAAQFGLAALSLWLFDDPQIICGGLGVLLLVGCIVCAIVAGTKKRYREAQRYCEDKIDSAEHETEWWDALSDETLHEWESRLDSSWEGDADV